MVVLVGLVLLYHARSHQLPTVSGECEDVYPVYFGEVLYQDGVGQWAEVVLNLRDVCCNFACPRVVSRCGAQSIEERIFELCVPLMRVGNVIVRRYYLIIGEDGSKVFLYVIRSHDCVNERVFLHQLTRRSACFWEVYVFAPFRYVSVGGGVIAGDDIDLW